MEYYRRLIGVLAEDLLQDCQEDSKHNENGSCGDDVQCRKIHLDRNCYWIIAQNVGKVMKPTLILNVRQKRLLLAWNIQPYETLVGDIRPTAIPS